MRQQHGVQHREQHAQHTVKATHGVNLASRGGRRQRREPGVRSARLRIPNRPASERRGDHIGLCTGCRRALAPLPGADQAEGRRAHRVHGDRRHAARQPRTAAARGADAGAISASRSPPPAPPPSTTCSTGASTSRWRARARRPLPSGALTEREALIFAAVLGVTAMAILAFLVNLLTAVLTFCSLIGYAVDLHRVAEARDLAEHRDRRRGRRGAAGAGLGRGDRQRRPERAAAVPHHLRVDAAALLGAGDRAPRRVRARRHPDAAGDARRRVHAPAGAAVHGAAGRW